MVLSFCFCGVRLAADSLRVWQREQRSKERHGILPGGSDSWLSRAGVSPSFLRGLDASNRNVRCKTSISGYKALC